MKFLRALLIIILIVVVILVILGLVGPKDYDISQTATIDAPREMVFPYLTSLKKAHEWGPWKDQDPEMEVTFEGEEGSVGAKSAWEGPVAGKGEQTVVAIQENTAVDSDLTFYTPFGAMQSRGYLQIDDADGGSTVTWGFKGENNFIARIMGVFMNMEKSMNPMFAQGLQNLDSLIQADMSKEYNGQTISLQDVDARSFMAKRAVVTMENMQSFYASHLPRILAAAGRAGVEMQGMPCGLYYTWDEEGGSTDMAAAIPVAEAFNGRDMEMVEIPAGKALVIDYYGSYDNLNQPHEAMQAYLDHFGLTAGAPVIEEYVTDPATEPDPSKWLTRITYLLEI